MEIFKIAIGSLSSNKLRSSLTILGIIVGIFSIISISTIIVMLQNSIEDGVSLLGQNTFQIQKFPVIVSGGHSEWAKYRNRKDITLEQYNKLKEKLVGAKYVGAEQWGFRKIIQYGNKETNPNVQLCGCTVEAFPNNKWNISEGRSFNEDDIRRYQKFVVLGADVADVLFNYQNPIGSEIKVDGKKLYVIGVLEKQGELFGMSQDNFAVMPISTFQSFYGKRSRSINITVTSPKKEEYADLIEIASGHMRIIRKVPLNEEDDFAIFSNQSILRQINGITQGVRIGAFVIAAIALLAAGVGIMNIMLVSVTERTREIGIRKAIGAKRKNILSQFLAEAIVLCLMGGVIGIVFGVSIGNWVGSFLNATAVIPINWIIFGISLCIFIGILFGTYPAFKAAQLDPIEALRYE
ncbi:ABC transporter permease [Bacteroidota bacterium]